MSTEVKGKLVLVFLTISAVTVIKSDNDTNSEFVYGSGYDEMSDDIPSIHMGPSNDPEICGWPIFVHQQRCENLSHESLLYECVRPAGEVFVVFNVFLGLVITLGSCSLPIALSLNRKLRDRHGCLKVSLSISDQLVGWLILCQVVPNSIWINSITKYDLLKYIIDSEDTKRSIIMGSIFVLSVQASSLHLLVMAMERFMATWWPFAFRRMPLKMTLAACFSVWISASLLACFPAMMKKRFSYQFQSVWLLDVMVVDREHNNSLGLNGTYYIMFTLFFPYCATMLFTILAIWRVWWTRRSFRTKHRQKRLKEKSPSSSSESSSLNGAKKVELKKGTKKRTAKPEVRALITTAIMMTAYSLASLPLGIVFVLYQSKVLTCADYSIPWALAFYMRIINSLANLVIYSFRDKEFRQTWENQWLKLRNWNSRSGSSFRN